MMLNLLVKIFGKFKGWANRGSCFTSCCYRKRERTSFSKVSEEKYHAVTKFNLVNGDSVKSNSNVPTYTSVFSNTFVILQKMIKK